MNNNRKKIDSILGEWRRSPFPLIFVTDTVLRSTYIELYNKHKTLIKKY